jgi:hypothetical protein
MTPNVVLKSTENASSPKIEGSFPGVGLGDLVPLNFFSVKLPPGTNSFVLEYTGEIKHPISRLSEADAQSSPQTPGLISEEGIYLAGTSFWYPHFGEVFLSFSLEVSAPEDWGFVSQGKQVLQKGKKNVFRVQWESPEPQEEIYLIGGKFTQYSKDFGQVKALVFLRSPDEYLANTYLETTGQYLEMYSNLLGAYPYSKFALVENFWETGYGMPSFTLLGPTVIRLPFILHSSYPHEILHNWWGNGVFVDFEQGNWSEGLTTYLADHLIHEQRGSAVGYRRSILQNYTDYVHEGRDFPLIQFRARHGSLSQAIGYGKTLMFFHMLRLQLGDKNFIQGLQKFYHAHRFQRATFQNLQKFFSGVSGEDLSFELDQWVKRTGSPVIKIHGVNLRAEGDQFYLRAVLEQTQPEPVYRLLIPIAVYLKGEKKAFQTTILMDQKQVKFEFGFEHLPLRIEVDPEFDVFRRLDRKEVPPSLSLAYGGENSIILLPSRSEKKIRKGFQQLAESWKKSRPGKIEMKWDSEIDQLPHDRTLWIFGWENRFRSAMIKSISDYSVSFNALEVFLPKAKLRKDQHTIVLVSHHPTNPNLAMTWVGTENDKAIPGLGRKIIHYGKYGYLGFEGDSPSNIVKGEWPILNSPMSVSIPQMDGKTSLEMEGSLAPRKALINPPHFFQTGK